MLTGKKILVLGGTGFAGTTISNLLSKCNADVYTFSRKGHPNSSTLKSKSLHGDILKPEKHAALINQMDIIVHSIGTLIDTSVTKFAKPGQPGTYEQVNRDTLLSLLKIVTTPKKIFYLSAYGQIPLIPKRYISTKLQAQQALFNSIHESYILKPGMIYSWKSKKFTLPMKYLVNSSASALSLILDNIPSQLSSPLKKYAGGKSTALKDIAQTIAYISNTSVQDHILFNKEIQKYSQKYIDSIIGKGNDM